MSLRQASRSGHDGDGAGDDGNAELARLLPGRRSSSRLSSSRLSGSRAPLSAELLRKKSKNMHKRVKLSSKRMRQHWSKIAAFLDVQSVVYFGCTCQRLYSILANDVVWQQCLDHYAQKQVNQLLVSSLSWEQSYLRPRQRLRQLVHARYLVDPTNVLQARLEAAQRKRNEDAVYERLVTGLARMNLPPILGLACFSVGMFALHRGTMLVSSTVHTLRTFLVVEDVLSVVAVVVLMNEHAPFNNNALLTCAALAMIQVAMVLYTLAVVLLHNPSTTGGFHDVSADAIIHAGAVIVILGMNLWIGSARHRAYMGEIGASDDGF